MPPINRIAKTSIEPIVIVELYLTRYKPAYRSYPRQDSTRWMKRPIYTCQVIHQYWLFVGPGDCNDRTIHINQLRPTRERSVLSISCKSLSAWWRRQMQTFSALLAICVGNSPVTGEFPAQRPVTRSFDVFFDLRLNKLLSKQSWGWWFETVSRPLWRHCNGLSMFWFSAPTYVLQNQICN